MNGESDASMNPGANEGAMDLWSIKKPPDGGFFMRGMRRSPYSHSMVAGGFELTS